MPCTLVSLAISKRMTPYAAIRPSFSMPRATASFELVSNVDSISPTGTVRAKAGKPASSRLRSESLPQMDNANTRRDASYHSFFRAVSQARASNRRLLVRKDNYHSSHSLQREFENFIQMFRYLTSPVRLRCDPSRRLGYKQRRYGSSNIFVEITELPINLLGQQHYHRHSLVC